ncbi:MAG: hypothetical protein HQL35_14345 [Alphaproteobacteria bacterium]|nr:hypothetical protein [Alphaproteobacteria bacterium]
MPTRIEHLADLQFRLLNKTAAGARVYRSRTARTDARDLPAILLYAPDETGEPVGAGAPQYAMDVTLAVEVRVNGVADDWDTQAAGLMDEIKQILFTDPAWTARWARAARFQVHQYLDGQGEAVLAGEVLTLTCRDDDLAVFEPVGLTTLDRIDVTVDHAGPDGPDGVTDATIIAESTAQP